MKPTIAVDFDKTLTRKDVQDFVKSIMDKVDVFVLTYRYDFAHYHLYNGAFPETINNHDLWEVVEELGLSRKVIFTNCKAKSEYLNSCGGVLALLDDDYRVMNDLTANSKVLPIQVRSASYKKKILRLIDKWYERTDN